MDKLFNWLTLIRTPGVNARCGQLLLERFENPGDIRRASRQDLKTVGLSAQSIAFLKTPDKTLISNDIDAMRSSNAQLIPLGSDQYPSLLSQIPDPPLALFVRGNAITLCMPQLAMIGSRNPSPGGKENAFEFAQHLSECGITITSGLALGIDTECHRGALAAQSTGETSVGKTVAVMGTGIDNIYPAQQAQLADAIARQGALVSEFPPGTAPKREHFPQRNRIISGLSLGVLVVEAAQRSGSLITARHASDQGRDVFAIPGSIHNPMARGCHRLIRQGAKLVESADDIFEELESLLARLGIEAITSEGVDTGGVQVTSPGPGHDDGGDTEYSGLLDALAYDAQPVDIIIQRTGLTADEVSSMLLILELEGKVASAPGGRYARVRKRDA